MRDHSGGITTQVNCFSIAEDRYKALYTLRNAVKAKNMRLITGLTNVLHFGDEFGEVV